MESQELNRRNGIKSTNVRWRRLKNGWLATRPPHLKDITIYCSKNAGISTRQAISQVGRWKASASITTTMNLLKWIRQNTESQISLISLKLLKLTTTSSAEELKSRYLRQIRLLEQSYRRMIQDTALTYLQQLGL